MDGWFGIDKGLPSGTTWTSNVGKLDSLSLKSLSNIWEQYQNILKWKPLWYSTIRVGYEPNLQILDYERSVQLWKILAHRLLNSRQEPIHSLRHTNVLHSGRLLTIRNAFRDKRTTLILTYRKQESNNSILDLFELGQVFNYRCGRACMPCSAWATTKHPNHGPML
jgi:hypothetical protein